MNDDTYYLVITILWSEFYYSHLVDNIDVQKDARTGPNTSARKSQSQDINSGNLSSSLVLVTFQHRKQHI